MGHRTREEQLELIRERARKAADDYAQRGEKFITFYPFKEEEDDEEDKDDEGPRGNSMCTTREDDSLIEPT